MLGRSWFRSKNQCNVSIIKRSKNTISAWNLHSFHSNPKDALVLNQNASMPVIENANQVIVKIMASSVNPIDLEIAKGFGANAFGFLSAVDNLRFERGTYDRFPLVLGRDFSGIITNRGQNVKRFEVGDEIFGALLPHQQGSFSEYLVVCQTQVSHMPKNTSHEEAASIPYAGLTAWSALSLFGSLDLNSIAKKRILVLGGTGGVGTISIQFLKAYGAYVAATCLPSSHDWLKANTNVDETINYTDNSISSYDQLFDFILDARSKNQNNDTYDAQSLKALKKWSGAKYVTLTNPLLSSMGANGLVFGLLSSAGKAGLDTLHGLSEGTSIRWAYFCPNQFGLKTLASLVEKNQLKPIIEKIYDFNELPLAFEKVGSGHARGKTVIRMKM